MKKIKPFHVPNVGMKLKRLRLCQCLHELTNSGGKGLEMMMIMMIQMLITRFKVSFFAKKRTFLISRNLHKISGGSGFGNRDYLDVEHDDDDEDDDYEYSENESEEETSDEDEN